MTGGSRYGFDLESSLIKKYLINQNTGFHYPILEWGLCLSVRTSGEQKCKHRIEDLTEVQFNLLSAYPLPFEMSLKMHSGCERDGAYQNTS